MAAVHVIGTTATVINQPHENSCTRAPSSTGSADPSFVEGVGAAKIWRSCIQRAAAAGNVMATNYLGFCLGWAAVSSKTWEPLSAIYVLQKTYDEVALYELAGSDRLTPA